MVAAFVSGAAMLLIGAVPEVGAVLAGMALWGFGWTFRSGAEDAWLADEVGTAALGSAYQRGAQVGRVTGLLGIVAAVGLASVDLSLPFLAAGAVTVVLGLYLVVALVIFLVLGSFEEGFDRLWEAHLLLDVGLPDIGPLGDVAWFGVLGAATLVLSFAVAAPLVHRWGRLGAARLARLLLVLHGALVGCALAFALAGSLVLAVAAFLATAVVRNLTGPLMMTWLNGTITDSSVRATVLSITSMAGSAGEWAGGPALMLFTRAARHHGREPERSMPRFPTAGSRPSAVDVLLTGRREPPAATRSTTSPPAAARPRPGSPARTCR